MKLLVTELDRRLRGSPYQGYAYAYPHKTAYRPFAEPLPLSEVWRDEGREALFLYAHVPFCEFRCGFCNLFTQTNPQESLVERWLATLARQVEQTGQALGPASFARLAVGGGTPTQLELPQLARLFELLRSLGARPEQVPVSCEMSPDTVDPDKLALLREAGVDRASMGVQSFLEDEARAAGRPQRTARVEQAVEWIQAAGFPLVNLDLIYGLPGQTEESWLFSLARLVELGPSETFLYPLYVRPLTGLGKRDGADQDYVLGDPERDPRLRLYRLGREFLLERGYEQVSMRLFRQRGQDLPPGPAYSCQQDGMVGLGVGARSYTRALHYASEYAVGAKGVRSIIADWVERSDAELARADYGTRLDPEEQRRRFTIQSLLHSAGLDRVAYRARFGSDPEQDLPELTELEPRGLAAWQGEVLRLTPAGFERSDVLGPWLYSAAVNEQMAGYELT